MVCCLVKTKCVEICAKLNPRIKCGEVCATMIHSSYQPKSTRLLQLQWEAEKETTQQASNVVWAGFFFSPRLKEHFVSMFTLLFSFLSGNRFKFTAVETITYGGLQAPALHMNVLRILVQITVASNHAHMHITHYTIQGWRDCKDSQDACLMFSIPSILDFFSILFLHTIYYYSFPVKLRRCLVSKSISPTLLR